MAEMLMSFDELPAELFHGMLFVLAWFVWLLTQIERAWNESKTRYKRDVGDHWDRVRDGIHCAALFRRPEQHEFIGVYEHELDTDDEWHPRETLCRGAFTSRRL